MRTTAIVLNSIAAVFFTGFVSYTFFARQHLSGLARDFVTEKTLEYSGPMVDLAEGSLETPLVQSLISQEQEAAIRDEIASYRQDSGAYIADLTRQEIGAEQPVNGNPVLDEIASVKEEIRVYYDDTLDALINDLRIFSTSNLVAGLFALCLAIRAREGIRQSTVLFSIVMFAAVLFCSWLYVDDLSFFRILFRTHMGWWYPVFLCAVAVGLYLDFRRLSPATDQLSHSTDGSSAGDA